MAGRLLIVKMINYDKKNFSFSDDDVFCNCFCTENRFGENYG